MCYNDLDAQSLQGGCVPHAGLDMRVAFGDVWKESLTELSGGQRSLLALSLILALCRWAGGVSFPPLSTRVH